MQCEEPNNENNKTPPKKIKKKPRIDVLSETNEQNNKTIPTRGTGAGGANTNKTGLGYEDSTDLNKLGGLKIIKKDQHSMTIKFKNDERQYVKTDKTNLFKYMRDKMDHNIKRAHGCKSPDECYIDKEHKRMFIIEKKFQQTPGSVCEKIQTAHFKSWQYSRTFLDYTIIYIYCLSDWFKENCIAELEYLDFMKIPYFWGSSETYKDDIVNFILSYK